MCTIVAPTTTVSARENDLTGGAAAVAGPYGEIPVARYTGAKYTPLKHVQLPCSARALPRRAIPIHGVIVIITECAHSRGRYSARTFGHAKLPVCPPQCGHPCRRTFSLPFNWINFLSPLRERHLPRRLPLAHYQRVRKYDGPARARDRARHNNKYLKRKWNQRRAACILRMHALGVR